MFSAFFKAYKPSAVAGIVFMAIVFWIPGFFSDSIYPSFNEFSVGKGMGESLKTTLWLSRVLQLIMVLCCAFMLNFLSNEQLVLAKKSYLPAFFFVLFFCLSPSLQLLLPQTIAIFFILMSVLQVVSSYRRDSALASVFNAGFFFGLACVIFFPVIWMFPALIVSIAIIRPFTLREHIIAALGFLTVALYVFTWHFWFDNLPALRDELFKFSSPDLNFSPGKWTMPILSVAGLFTIASTFLTVSGQNITTLKGRKVVNVFFWLTFFSIPVILFSGLKEPALWSLLIPGTALFSANYFLHIKRRWLSELWLWLFFTLIFLSAFLG